MRKQNSPWNSLFVGRQRCFQAIWFICVELSLTEKMHLKFQHDQEQIYAANTMIHNQCANEKDSLLETSFTNTNSFCCNSLKMLPVLFATSRWRHHDAAQLSWLKPLGPMFQSANLLLVSVLKLCALQSLSCFE